MKVISVLIALLLNNLAIAASTIQGDWQIIDDKTHERRAIIRLEGNKTLIGTIIKSYPKLHEEKNCIHCPGKFKDKPIVGLSIIWGLKEKSKDEWQGGRILDPQTGKIYRLKMTLKGNKLLVRGYLGVSLLGRTQTWIRNYR